MTKGRRLLLPNCLGRGGPDNLGRICRNEHWRAGERRVVRFASNIRRSTHRVTNKPINTNTPSPALGACIVGTAGLCGIAAGVAVAASVAHNGYRAYKKEITPKRAIANVATDFALSRFRALRAIRIRPKGSLKGGASPWNWRRSWVTGRTTTPKVRTRTVSHRAAFRYHPYRFSVRVGVNIYAARSTYSSYRDYRRRY